MHRDTREGSSSRSPSPRLAQMAAEMGQLSGAEYLASIFGTERDKVNCSFYFKIGACRHGDKCSRMHNRPTYSQTLLMKNLYRNPMLDARQADVCFNSKEDGAMEQEHFDDFFEEVFIEIEDCYGEIEEMNVCDNIGEHMIGNVYVKFRREEDAERALHGVSSRWFAGAPIYAELSPVTDFREACCRQYESGECTRGGFCNFMHLKPISHQLRRELYNRNHAWRAKKPKRRKLKSWRRSESPSVAGSIHSRTSVNEALPQAYQCAESSSSSSETDSDSQLPRRRQRQRILSSSSNVPAAFRLDRFESSSSSELDSDASHETDADTLSSLRSSQRTQRSVTSPVNHDTKTPSPSTRSRTVAATDMKRCRKERWKMLNSRLKKRNGELNKAMNGSSVIDDDSERSFVFSLL